MNPDISARYEQAQSILQGMLTKRVVRNDSVFPHWIDDNHFWYVRDTKAGKDFRLVDAKTGSNTPAFDQQALADALTGAMEKAPEKPVDHQDLPVKNVVITLSPLQVRFEAWGKHWLYKPDTKHLQEDAAPAKGLRSPDGKKEAFVREHNLWVRDVTSGEESALTTDGAAETGYACSLNATNTRVEAKWSPDSTHLFTVQVDIRSAAERPFILYAPQDGKLQPQLLKVKISYPGDEHVESYRLLTVDVSTGKQQAADYASMAHPFFGALQEGVFSVGLAWWSGDGKKAFFVEVTRGTKAVRVVELNTKTGATRLLFEETSDTFVKLRQDLVEHPLFVPLPDSDELIWFSERTGSMHLYLYDLKTGKLKNTITQGQWMARRVLRCDPKRREVLLATAGRDPAISPYYQDVCRVNIDTGALTPLATGDFEHNVWQPDDFSVTARGAYGVDSPNATGASPSGQYFVTTRSRVDTIPVSVLIDREGKEITTLETADVSGLPKDWVWPEPVKTTAADGKTDIYGVVFRPPGFSDKKKYPVLNYSSTMRHHLTLPQGSFINNVLLSYAYLHASACAALGFVTVIMEGRGTPFRNKAFQEHNHGDLASTSDLNDRIAGLKQLAERHPYMDLTRVGITGWEAQTNTIFGLLDHPEFFKVAVINAFTDPRFGASYQSEALDGMLDPAVTAKMRHAENYVESLKGKLFFIQGMACGPESMFRVVEALQKANKDFDMLCLPNLGYQKSSYSLRREWDYLVKHLQGVEPPKEFDLTTGEDLAQATAAALGLHPE